MGRLDGRTILVTGLMDNRSTAWAIGQAIEREGGEVEYTIQRKAVMRNLQKPQDEGGINVRLTEPTIHICDVTKPEEVAALAESFSTRGIQLDGFVHCIGFANPSTCLNGDMLETPEADAIEALKVSAVSLQTLASALNPHLVDDASIVALTFESRVAFPVYDWMGVAKATLEAIARGLTRLLGPINGTRINCISAGPMETMAASRIPGFEKILKIWRNEAPVGWNPEEGQTCVAETAVFLLSPESRYIAGQTIHVDGGFSSVRVQG